MKNPTNPDEQTKTFTLEDIKKAYIDGYYEGAGDDAWYRDHPGADDSKLTDKAFVYRPLKEYLEELK